MAHDSEIKQARNLAYRYLSYRDRSTHEVKTHLLKKEISCDTVEEVLEDLKRLNYLNDARFAEQWGQARQQNKLVGKFRLRQELLQKGLEPDLVENTLEGLYDAGNELELAQACAQTRSKALKGLEPSTQKRRLAQFLQRKGYSGEVIYQILDDWQNP